MKISNMKKSFMFNILDSNTGRIVIIFDLNASVGNKLDETIYHCKHGEDIWSDNGKRLIYFCTENN